MKEQIDSVQVSNQLRIGVYNSLKILSYYGAALRLQPGVRHEEKSTLTTLTKFADNTLSKINRIKKQRISPQAVQQHEDTLEDNAAFLMDWMELGQLICKFNNSREKALEQTEKLIADLNKKAFKEHEYQKTIKKL